MYFLKYDTQRNKKIMDPEGIDPPASRMQSERSTIWANSPSIVICKIRTCAGIAHQISSLAP